MNREVYHLVSGTLNAILRKVGILCMVSAFCSCALNAGPSDTRSFTTETSDSVLLPWKVRELTEMLDLWKKTSSRTHLQTLLAWNKQRSVRMTNETHFNVLVKLPAKIHSGEVAVTARIDCKTPDAKTTRWTPADTEARLIQAVINRAKATCHCTNVVAMEIEMHRFYFTPLTANHGEPALSFKVIFEKDGRAYDWTLQLFISLDGKRGTKIPGLGFKVLRDTKTDGTYIPDNSNIIDGWEGVFQDVGGSIRSAE